MFLSLFLLNLINEIIIEYFHLLFNWFVRKFCNAYNCYRLTTAHSASLAEIKDLIIMIDLIERARKAYAHEQQWREQISRDF